MKDHAPDGINGDTTPHNKARRMAPMGVYELMQVRYRAAISLYSILDTPERGLKNKMLIREWGLIQKLK